MKQFSLSQEHHKKIKDMFNQGKSFTTIKWELFNQCNCPKCKKKLEEKNIEPFRFKDFLIIIGKTQDEYFEEFKKLYSLAYTKARSKKTDNQPCWNTIKNECLKRDNFECGFAYCKEKAEVVHHIISYAICKTHKLDNLISLCGLHHKRVHSYSDNFELFPKKIGRNEPCPCGSGKKYKKCCLEKTN